MGHGFRSLLDKRNRTIQLQDEAECLFSDSIGDFQMYENPEIGFTVRASQLYVQRRRLEEDYWTPAATAFLRRFHDPGLKVEALSEVSERIWWMTLFKRVFGNEGDVSYMSADQLFTQNAAVTKRVVIEQAENASDYFVKAGWIIMACSGQVYGLNGSFALMTKKHEHAFFSHDLGRIIPKHELIRPDYLFTVLGHPKLGRPLVIRNAYGTSIPRLEPTDIAAFPVVLLSSTLTSVRLTGC